MQKIAVFASGSGTNAAAIADYFSSHPHIEVALVLSNNPDAGVLEKAKLRDIPTLIIDKGKLNSRELEQYLEDKEIDCIVLAGFLKLIPSNLLKKFHPKIINIHPALLPAYGGKGMYGMNVHRAVSDSGDTETGITIHLVNEEYDKGQHLFQAKTRIEPGEDPNAIAGKVLKLEHHFFPRVIEHYLLEENQ
nr:phosphoribosylglycinamide formyltransferase [Saprospiraceae bacterium]